MVRFYFRGLVMVLPSDICIYNQHIESNEYHHLSVLEGVESP